jgi:hypothetical protein
VSADPKSIAVFQTDPHVHALAHRIADEWTAYQDSKARPDPQLPGRDVESVRARARGRDQCRGYHTKHGDAQIEVLSRLLMYHSVFERVPDLLIPGRPCEQFYDLLVISEDAFAVRRKGDPYCLRPDGVVFFQCAACRQWILPDRFCCCDSGRYRAALALTVERGKLLLNGNLLESVLL